MTKQTPPKHLSAVARALWTRLRSDFAIDDSAGLALLQAACEAHDRAQQARNLIDSEGLVSVDRFGQRKPHPGVGIERDSRQQMMAALRALRLAPEADL